MADRAAFLSMLETMTVAPTIADAAQYLYDHWDDSIEELDLAYANAYNEEQYKHLEAACNYIYTDVRDPALSPILQIDCCNRLGKKYARNFINEFLHSFVRAYLQNWSNISMTKKASDAVLKDVRHFTFQVVENSVYPYTLIIRKITMLDDTVAHFYRIRLNLLGATLAKTLVNNLSMPADKEYDMPDINTILTTTPKEDDGPF